MKTKRKTKKEFKKRILEQYGYEMKYSGKLKKWFRHRVNPIKLKTLNNEKIITRRMDKKP
jgi:hypothetical protein